MLTSGLENLIPSQFDPKMSSLFLLEAKITLEERALGNYCDGCGFCGRGRVVSGGSVCVDFGCVRTVGGFQRGYDNLTP